MSDMFGKCGSKFNVSSFAEIKNNGKYCELVFEEKRYYYSTKLSEGTC